MYDLNMYVVILRNWIVCLVNFFFLFFLFSVIIMF